MKAICRSEYGSADILHLREIDKPTPKENEILIKVSATSVNPFDWHVLRGDPWLIRLFGYGLFKPKHTVLGADISGVVVTVGDEVTAFKQGDEVFGSGLGGFAQFACLRENEVAIKPPSVTHESAATIPIAGITALQALRDKGKVQSGQQILINGASGGVGTFAVQIAKVLDAHVTGVCSGPNCELVQSLGADHVIDYTQENYWESDKQYDVIIDNASYYSVRKPLRVLKRSGIYVPVGGPSTTWATVSSMLVDPILAPMQGKKVASFVASITRADLEYLGDLVASDKVTPIISETLPLKEVARAIRQSEEGHTRGKIVISVG